MKKEFTEEKTNRYQNMLINLKNINNLSLNEVKYLYNNFYNYKKNYLSYRFTRLTPLRNIIKFICVLIIVLFMNSITLNFMSILMLYGLLLLGYFSLGYIDEILKQVLENKYTKDLTMINDKIYELQKKESLTSNTNITYTYQETHISNITPTKDMTLSRKLIKK